MKIEPNCSLIDLAYQMVNEEPMEQRKIMEIKITEGLKPIFTLMEEYYELSQKRKEEILNTLFDWVIQEKSKNEMTKINIYQDSNSPTDFSKDIKGLYFKKDNKCPKCEVIWEKDSDVFGCWSCGWLQTNKDKRMNPKEKAELLFNKFYFICQEYTEEIQCSIQAKQCSLICVDEIINFTGRKELYMIGSKMDVKNIPSQYWQEVKKEIEKI